MSSTLKATTSEARTYDGATAAVATITCAPGVPRLYDAGVSTNSSSISPVVVRGLVRLADFVVVAAVGFAIAVLYINEMYVANNPRYLSAILATSVATIVIFELLGLYGQRVF